MYFKNEMLAKSQLKLILAIMCVEAGFYQIQLQFDINKWMVLMLQKILNGTSIKN